MRRIFRESPVIAINSSESDNLFLIPTINSPEPLIRASDPLKTRRAYTRMPRQGQSRPLLSGARLIEDGNYDFVFFFSDCSRARENRYIEHITEAWRWQSDGGGIRSNSHGVFRSWMPRGVSRQRAAQHNAAQRNVWRALQLARCNSLVSSRRHRSHSRRHRSYWSMVEPLTIGACTECFGTNLNLAASPPAAYTTSN